MNTKSLTVDEFTTPSPISVSPEDSLNTVWTLMKDNSVRHILVTSDTETVGILSERDITTFSQAEYFSSLKAKDVMSTDLMTVAPNTRLYEVALQMSEKKIGSTLVKDESSGELGIFTSTDALNALVEVLRGDLD